MLWYRHCTLPGLPGFPDSSRRYGGSCIAINPSHRDRRRVRTLRCSLLRVKRCYLLTVDREPSRAALSAHGSSPPSTRVGDPLDDPRDHDIQTCDIGDRAMPGRGPARCRSPSRCPLSCSGPAPAAWVVPIGRCAITNTIPHAQKMLTNAADSERCFMFIRCVPPHN